MVARPFFMTLPGYPGRMDEKEILNDLEYLQQTYPGEVRRCQRRIAEILDKYDYEGSMIYDEYPDRFSLYRIADTIGKILERESGKVSLSKDISLESSWLIYKSGITDSLDCRTFSCSRDAL